MDHEQNLSGRVTGDTIQGYAEVVAVGGQQGVIAGQLVFGAGFAAGPDQRSAADRDPAAVFGEPRADGLLGEGGQRRRLLPPAGGNEVGQGPSPQLDPVLRLAVLEHLDVAVRGVGQQEPASRILLLGPAVQHQRTDAVPAEAHIRQPRAAAVGKAYEQRQVVIWRPEPLCAVHARGSPRYLGAQRLQQERERPVEFVAEPAPPVADDLGYQVVFVQRDRLAQVDAQVLERHGDLVSPVQHTKRRCVGGQRRSETDPLQIGLGRALVHHAPPVPGGGWIGVFWPAATHQVPPRRTSTYSTI